MRAQENEKNSSIKTAASGSNFTIEAFYNKV